MDFSACKILTKKKQQTTKKTLPLHPRFIICIYNYYHSILL